MSIIICANCGQEYNKGERHDIGHKSDYKLGGFPIWFYKAPEHEKDSSISHGICPCYYVIEMKKLR